MIRKTSPEWGGGYGVRGTPGLGRERKLGGHLEMSEALGFGGKVVVGMRSLPHGGEGA